MTFNIEITYMLDHDSGGIRYVSIGSRVLCVYRSHIFLFLRSLQVIIDYRRWFSGIHKLLSFQ